MEFTRIILGRCTAFSAERNSMRIWTRSCRRTSSWPFAKTCKLALHGKGHAPRLCAFGGVTQIRKSYRVQRGVPGLEEAARDFRYRTRAGRLLDYLQQHRVRSLHKDFS